jgi:hypothetical protein
MFKTVIPVPAPLIFSGRRLNLTNLMVLLNRFLDTKVRPSAKNAHFI